MKTVTGKAVSFTPVTVSRGASILSEFVSADTCASDPISAYLRRASACFIELSRLQQKRRRSSSHPLSSSVPPRLGRSQMEQKETVKENGVSTGGNNAPLALKSVKKKRRRSEDLDS